MQIKITIVHKNAKKFAYVIFLYYFCGGKGLDPFPVARLVGVTLPATPAVRRAKSRHFSID